MTPSAGVANRAPVSHVVGNMNRITMRKLLIVGAATGALTFGVGFSASASTPPGTAPPGSEAPAGSAATGGGGIVSTAPCGFCTLLTDAAGMTLYAFTPDSPGQSTCTGDCATNWPPLFVEGGAVPAGLDPNLYSLADNADGQVLQINGHPLYYFAGDKAPGDTNGQGLGGKWYAVTPEGQMIGEAEGEGDEAAAPAGTAPAATSMASTGATEGGY